MNSGKNQEEVALHLWKLTPTSFLHGALFQNASELGLCWEAAGINLGNPEDYIGDMDFDQVPRAKSRV